LPLPRWQVVRLALSSVVPFLRRVVSYQKRLPTLLAAAPQRCETLQQDRSQHQCRRTAQAVG
jgi:hypothetical protein